MLGFEPGEPGIEVGSFVVTLIFKAVILFGITFFKQENEKQNINSHEFSFSKSDKNSFH